MYSSAPKSQVSSSVCLFLPSISTATLVGDAPRSTPASIQLLIDFKCRFGSETVLSEKALEEVSSTTFVNPVRLEAS